MSYVQSLEALSGQRFGAIYADPPWQYQRTATTNTTQRHYQTMPLTDIKALPIRDLRASPCHLHLWTTTSFLFEAKEIIEAWGFEYRSCFVWVKPQIGMGSYWRVAHEFLLLGVHGSPTTFRRRNLKSWGEFDRGRHSAKPDAVRHMIEDASHGPYLELFGREDFPGWTVFGNEQRRQGRLA